jgi:uncharacterized protein YecE (DUF72 family)
MQLFIGTSGWHYDHWTGQFYPPEVKGYNELRYLSGFYNTVENNSSFYRIAQESTYKTWSRMTPDDYKFSMKLNKQITHIKHLELSPEVCESIGYILQSTQVLGNKLGSIVIQLPPSFRIDIAKLDAFLKYFMAEVERQPFRFDVAIEFRHKTWFSQDVFELLGTYNVALVTGQSSRYPEVRHVTADFAYIRMHGPEKLFSSKYTTEQLTELGTYISQISSQVERVYVYFNNDFHGYALENAQELMDICGLPKPTESAARR